MKDKIQLLQFLICKEFREQKQDAFIGETIQSNIYVSKFPHRFTALHVVTCWRKDSKFHKEVIEYITEDGETARSPHMDIEPAEGSVLFRWHAHQFPPNFLIKKPTILTIRVILDGKAHFESYIMIESRTGKK